MNEYICGFGDFCDKAVIVLVPHESVLLNDPDCVLFKAKDEKNKVRIRSCPSTGRRVFLAARRAQEAFLKSFIGLGVEAGDGDKNIVIPRTYRSIASTPAKTNLATGQLNNLALVIRYDESGHCLSTDCLSNKCDSCDDTGKIKQVSATGLSVITTVGKKPFSGSQTFNATIMPYSIPNTLSGVELQIGFVEHWQRHWGAFDALAVYSNFLPLKPSVPSLVGGSLLGVSLGIDHIWDGRNSRDLNVALGPEAIIELGRYVFYARPMVEEQWNENYKWSTGVSITFGVRVPALKLYPQNLP